jgi:hypothetical protein
MSSKILQRARRLPADGPDPETVNRSGPADGVRRLRDIAAGPPCHGRTGWQEHALVLDVAAAAATISCGAGLSRKGELLVSQLAFEEVGSEVPVTAGPIAHGSRRTSTSARPSSPDRHQEQAA